MGAQKFVKPLPQENLLKDTTKNTPCFSYILEYGHSESSQANSTGITGYGTSILDFVQNMPASKKCSPTVHQ